MDIKNELKKIQKQTFVDFMENTNEDDLITVEQIDELIEKHRESIKFNRRDIRNSQQRIENLEYKKNKLKYGEHSLTIEFADKMHEAECRSTICDYHTITWEWWLSNSSDRILEKSTYYAAAAKYLEKAKELGVSYRKAITLYRNN